MDLSALNLGTSVEQINEIFKDSLIGNLHITIDRMAEGEVCARMPVCPQTARPDGMLHGGSNLALAETIAGLGSMLLINMTTHDVRGMQVSASHTGSLREGTAYASAKIIHRGNRTHVWNVDVKNSDGRLISSARVTNIIVKKK
ncbi:MAG: PaaI family thioesterase [Mangrovibacterium sp.]